MRHNRKFNHLSRKKAHRGAMLSNMATSLIMHKRVFTTVAKAKALRKYVEPIITKSKEDTTHSRRVVFGSLQNKTAVTELFQNISQKIAERPGGYTRIIKTGFRLGDNAAMCFIELVDYNENMLSDTSKKKVRTRRSRRKKSEDSAEVTAGATQPKKETKTIEKVESKSTQKEKIDEAPKEKVIAESKPVKSAKKEVTEEEKAVEKNDTKAKEPNPAADVQKDVSQSRDKA